MKSVSEEKSGWRDERISRRHREWGVDCPMVDIDKIYSDSNCPMGYNAFICLEYDRGQPKAIVEFKHEWAKNEFEAIINSNRLHPNYRSSKILTDNSRIPYLIVLYADDLTWYRVHPMNDYARNYVKKTVKMSELEFVTLQYDIRGRTIPEEILEKLKKGIYEEISDFKSWLPMEFLWPILVETVHTLPMYLSHKAYVRDRLLLEEPNISMKEISFRLDISLGEAMVILHEKDVKATGSQRRLRTC